jgi:Leucine-rich repeat (LRR) protein
MMLKRLRLYFQSKSISIVSRKSLLLILFLQCLTIVYCALPTDPKLPAAQYNALYDLYNSTNGHSWVWPDASDTSKPWDFNAPDPNPCFDDWQGIFCICDTDINYCDLSELYLSVHNPTGTLPDTIGNWQSIIDLDLSKNNITGTIPETVSSLQKINALILGHNTLNGTIPKGIGSLRFLNKLVLSSNRLTSLPDEVFNATNLFTLQLEDNALQGTLSPNIGNLRHLREFTILNNKFTSKIPATLGNCSSLDTLDMSYNRFTGPLPNSMGQLLNLTTLTINDNKITGTLPASIGNLEKLVSILLYDNDIFGPIPSSWGNLDRLQLLDFIGNLLTGTIPSSFANLVKMKQIYIERTSLYGSIDPILSGMHLLTILYIEDNFFNGPIDSLKLQDLDIVTIFNVARNSFSGVLPVNPEWASLTQYEAAMNYFTGTISNDFSVLPDLYFFWTGTNYLSSALPDYFFRDVRSLTNFNVSYNLLSQHFPENITFSRITQLLANNNFFTGTLPKQLANLEALVILSLHDNSFSSSIPKDYRKLHFLEQFFLQNNQLSGSMNELLNDTLTRTVLNLDLSGNQFTGSLPGEYFKLNEVETFSIVSNCLSGSIPEEICHSRSLTALSLDGISTASNCRVTIFPTAFDGFSLKHYLQGSIPSCLFAMPKLQTLHLSGNGFTGTLSSNLTISSSLIDLELSHNILSGTIPSIFQNRPWINLDLSYNKLTGTLSHSFVNIPSNGSLYLEVNRLSGTVPSQLLATENINILTGNLFACNDPERDLPGHDPNDHSYSCGSNTVNDILYSWLAVCFIIFILLGWLYSIAQEERKKIRTTVIERLTTVSAARNPLQLQRLGNNVNNDEEDEEEGDEETGKQQKDQNNNGNGTEEESKERRTEPVKSSTSRHPSKGTTVSQTEVSFRALFTRVTDTLRHWIDAIEEFNFEHPNSNIHMLTTFLQQIRLAFILISIFAIVILMPTYAVVTEYSKSYSEEYAWTISGILLSGETPALVLFFFLLLLVVIVFVLLKNVFVATNAVKYLRQKSMLSRDSDDISLLSFSSSFLSRLSNQIDFQAPDGASIIEEQMTINKMNYRKVVLVHFFIFLLNTSLLGVVDFFYVIIAINNNSAVITLAAIFLAIFRLWTNNILLWKAIPMTSKWIIYLSYKFFPTKKITEFSSSRPQSQRTTFPSGTAAAQTTQSTTAEMNNNNSNNNRTSASSFSTFRSSFNTTKAPQTGDHHHSERPESTDMGTRLTSITLDTDDHHHKHEEYEKLPDDFWNIPYIFTSKDITFLEQLMLFNNLIIPIVAILVILPDCFYNALFDASSVSSSYDYYNCAEYYDRGIIGYDCDIFSQQTSYTPPFIYSYQCSSKIVINYVPVYIMMFIFVGIVLPIKNFVLKLTYDFYYSKIKLFQEDNPDYSQENYHLPGKKNEKGEKDPLAYDHFIFSYCQMLIPENLKSLKAHKDSHQPMLFAKLKLTTQLSSYLAIMIAIGGLFPPVTVIGCITVITITYYEELIIGRLLYQSKKQGYLWYQEKLEEDCVGITESLNLSLRSTVLVTCSLFAYIIFDTWGDQKGWESALPSTLLMAFFPLVVATGYQVYRSYWKWRRNRLAKEQFQQQTLAVVESHNKNNNNRGHSPDNHAKFTANNSSNVQNTKNNDEDDNNDSLDLKRVTITSQEIYNEPSSSHNSEGFLRSSDNNSSFQSHSVQRQEEFLANRESSNHNAPECTTSNPMYHKNGNSTNTANSIGSSREDELRNSNRLSITNAKIRKSTLDADDMIDQNL